jgi:hypothetical protein
MPSLLDPDQTTPDAGAGLLGIGRPQIAPPDPGAVSQADALAQTYQAITAEIARQQQISADRGLWSGGGLLEGGHPTGEGVTDAAQQVAQSLLLGTSAPGGKGFTAYHGSPHSFDAFDTAAIGTGEGAQAYGHGLYFADKEGVARGYRDQLAQPAAPQLNATDYGLPQDAVDKIVASNMRQVTNMRGDHGFIQSALDQLGESNDPSSRIARDLYTNLLSQTPGHMYEVNINAPPEHFLDWDKPLSEQSPQVQQALSANPRVAEAIKYSDNPNNPTGRQIHNAMVSIAARKGGNGDVIASEALRDAGLPGIRYLDAGSRNAPNLTIIPPQQSYAGRWTVQDPVFRGQSKHFDTEADAQAYVAKQSPPATRNTVIFDPATIEILRKYGIAGLMAGGAGAVATQKPSQ